jgi:putative PIN family toxin of toxin-antitoxin system
VRIVLDNAILVRANGASNGLARDLLLGIVESDHILLLSNELLYELAKVLRYPRLMALHGLSEKRIYDYIGFLREVAELVVLNPLLVAPIRDVNDAVVMQTAIIGEADVLCTRDRDFFEAPAEAFLREAGIAVMDDMSLISRLRVEKRRSEL